MFKLYLLTKFIYQVLFLKSGLALQLSREVWMRFLEDATIIYYFLENLTQDLNYFTLFAFHSL
jgi:hypothetical protein